MSSGGASTEQAPRRGTNNNAAQTTTFPCQTCGKPFGSVQALGGHQNAHRRERFVIKRRQIEIKRHLARQSHQQLLLGRSTSSGSSAANAGGPFPAPPPAAASHPPPFVLDLNVPAQADLATDFLDLTLKL